MTGRAVARALRGPRRRGRAGRRPARGRRPAAAPSELGLALVEAPDADRARRRCSAGAGVAGPSPGVPERHPAFAPGRGRRRAVVGEFDLAAAWDDRPCLAVTGTNGKTTVTTLVTAMLRASGSRAVDAGNTEVPLVAAIDDPAPRSSWSRRRRSAWRRSAGSAPPSAAWLNFAPDHLDVHRRPRGLRGGQGRICGPEPTADDLAVANADDPVVLAHVAGAAAGRDLRLWPRPADWRVDERHAARSRTATELLAGRPTCPRAARTTSPTRWPRPATACGGGRDRSTASARRCASFGGLPHRVGSSAS